MSSNKEIPALRNARIPTALFAPLTTSICMCAGSALVSVDRKWCMLTNTNTKLKVVMFLRGAKWPATQDDWQSRGWKEFP